jgi:hypothetical protein
MISVVLSSEYEAMSIYALSICHYGTLLHSLCLQQALIYEIPACIFKDNFKTFPTKLDLIKRFLIESENGLLS